jgi:hypothetical protein
VKTSPPHGCYACGRAAIFSHHVQTTAVNNSGGSRVGVTGGTGTCATRPVRVTEKQGTYACEGTRGPEEHPEKSGDQV